MGIPAVNVLGNPNVTEGNFQVAIEDLRKSVVGSGKAYDSTNTYSQYDTCVSGGIVYYSKINLNTGNTPAINANWGLISELIKLISSPTTNALAKINVDGTIGNSTIINDATGNVGINTTPTINFDIVQLGATSGSYGIKLSQPSVTNNTAKLLLDTTSQRVILESSLGYGVSIKTNGTERLLLDSSGDITVAHTYNNTTASAANMFVDSTGKFFRSTSSKQYKTNIENVDKSYVDKFFSNAKPIYYKSLSNNDNPNWGYWGFIAEDIAEFDKRLVHWRYQTKDINVKKERLIPDVEEIKDNNGNIIQEAKAETIEKYIDIETVKDESKPLIAEGVMYERITVLLTSKVQEQQKIIDDLIIRLEKLENK